MASQTVLLLVCTLCGFILVVHNTKISPNPCCPQLCYCSSECLNVNCSSRGLSYTPRLPPKTTFLNMSGNVLQNITDDMIRNMTTRKGLYLLDVSNNNISFIQEGCLTNLSALNIFNVSQNPLSFNNLNSSFHGISSKLERLKLEGMNWNKVPYNLVKLLSNSSLKHLHLRDNRIKSFNGTLVFPYLNHLTLLDLASNFINELKLDVSKSLESLSLSSNDLTGVPECCFENVTYLPNLRSLYLDDNCIRSLNMTLINCLDELKLFNISATKIETLVSYGFANLKNLETITMERTGNLHIIQPNAFKSASLRRLFLKENHYIFYKNETVAMFNGIPNLTNLDVSSNYMGFLHNSIWYQVFSSLPNLTYLDISYNNILFLPQSIPILLTKLKIFHFKGNGASTIPAHYFRSAKNLETLLLNNNKFTVIHRNNLPPNLTKLQHLSLEYNPFECDCNILWFLEFAKKGKLYNFPRHYECAEVKKPTIDRAKISQQSCLIDKEINMIIRCTCVSVIAMLFILSVVYRYRWRLRYLIYILHYHRRRYTNPTQSYTHHLYVSCSDHDFKFVNEYILEKLEENYERIYCPHKHALPGSSIVETTLENIDTSCFILVCLSDSYAQDHWCEFEACMAIERSVCGSDKFMIVVMLEELSSVNVTKTIHRLMRNDDYIMWDVHREENNEDNWRRLLHQISENRPDLVNQCSIQVRS